VTAAADPPETTVRTRCLLPLLLGAWCVAGCSDEPVLLFTAEQAVNVARDFQRAFAAGDDAALAELWRTPFRFQSRTWDDQAEAAANLKKELPRIKRLHEGHDQFEALSRFDLAAGRWPRGEVVDEARRAERIEKLGVREDGWAVRVHSAGKPGYLLVLNAEGGARLVVTALEP
jgi:hypothetical protein